MTFLAIVKELLTPVCCVALIVWIAQDFRQSIKDALKKLESEIGRTVSYVKSHEESMGKFRKAIEGTMLKIKEDAFDFKNTINSQVNAVTGSMTSMEKQCIVLAAQMQMSADKYESQYKNFKEMLTAINECESKLKILMDKPAGPKYFDDQDETWSGKK